MLRQCQEISIRPYILSQSRESTRELSMLQRSIACSLSHSWHHSRDTLMASMHWQRILRG